MPFDVSFPDGPVAPEQLAALAGLRWVSDAEAGITRVPAAEGFSYLYPDRRPVRKKAHLQRIAALAIPPAWEEVWICRDPDGHLQATGRDAKGRKQYVYHEGWGEISNLAKFARMQAFGEALPGIREAVRDELRTNGPTLRKISALVVALLDRTCARVGNEEYVRTNRSYGLSTLRRRHVTVEAGRIELRFRAKGGLERVLRVEDRALARVLKKCTDRPGRRLFRYRNGTGGWEDLESDQVNDFLREIAGEAFTAKDFRTWKASAMVAGELYRVRTEAAGADRDTREALVRAAVDHAAEALGNTRTICRTYYTHPALIEAFEEGLFAEAVNGFRPGKRKWIDEDEQVLLRVLRHFGV